MRLFYLIIGIAYLALLQCAAFAQEAANWHVLPTHGLQNLHDVEAISSDTIVVLDAEGKILKTSNGGRTWTSSLPQAGKELKFYALRFNEESGVLLAAGESNSIFRSTNGGDSWESVYEGAADISLTFRAFSEDGSNYNPSLVFVVGDRRTIMKSKDDGKKWEKLHPTANIDDDCNSVTFVNPDTGFVSTNQFIFRTFDGGKNWTVISKQGNSKALKSKRKFSAGKALADELVNLVANGSGIEVSYDYGKTWSNLKFSDSCTLIDTDDLLLSKSQCDSLLQGVLVLEDALLAPNRWLLLSGATFRGILQPKWDNSRIEGVRMVLRSPENLSIIAETMSDELGRFELDVPDSFSGLLEVLAIEESDPEFCPRPLPHDYDTTMEPMPECDELTTLELRVISPIHQEMNDIALLDSQLLVVGNKGLILLSSPPDDDGDGYGDIWEKQNSRTSSNLLSVSARGIEKSDIRRGFIVAGSKGTVVYSQPAAFTIASPEAGSMYHAGETIDLRWNSHSDEAKVKLSLLHLSKGRSTVLKDSLIDNNGSLSWMIPKTVLPGTYQFYLQEDNKRGWAYGGKFVIQYAQTAPVCMDNCTENLLMNWNFNQQAFYGPMPSGRSAYWTSGSSPDFNAHYCLNGDSVSVGMWGNQVSHESIYQTLKSPFSPGRTYAVSITAKWHPLPGKPYPVQFEFKAYNQSATSHELIGLSAPFTLPGQWMTLNIPNWKAGGTTADPLSIFAINATNQSAAFKSDSISYGIITSVCVQEVIQSGNSEGLQSEKLRMSSYPNPISSRSTIEVINNERQMLSIDVLDVCGREIQEIVNQLLVPGVHHFEWDVDGIQQGVYFYRLKSNNRTIVQRVMRY